MLPRIKLWTIGIESDTRYQEDVYTRMADDWEEDDLDEDTLISKIDEEDEWLDELDD